MFHPPVAWSLVCSTSMCSLYNVLMWKLQEIIASYYIIGAACLMCFLMLRGTESLVPLIAVMLLQLLDCTPSLVLNKMILLECCRFFFKYLCVCMFLCCSHKLKAGICGFAQLWWKLWRSRSLQHTGISGSGVKQLKSCIHRALLHTHATEMCQVNPLKCRGWADVSLLNPQSPCSWPDNEVKSFISNFDKEH